MYFSFFNLHEIGLFTTLNGVSLDSGRTTVALVFVIRKIVLEVFACNLLALTFQNLHG